MRGRGLKQYAGRILRTAKGVAPHAGAWIETLNQTLWNAFAKVAPHAGAWIETFQDRLFLAL